MEELMAKTSTATALREVADIAVGICTAVSASERLLVLADTGSDPVLAEAIAEAGRRRNAEVIVLVFDQVASITDIPERVEEAVVHSDVVIPVCKSRILYSTTMRRAREHARVLYMADVATELFLRPVVRKADYEELARYARAFREILSGDHVLRVTSPSGTKGLMQMVSSRDLALSTCRARERGDHDYLPGGAWFGCPLEESVTGTFVIDCSLEPGIVGGLVDEPIALSYRAGRLVAVEGGAQAREFRAWLESGDADIYGVAHNGGGFNHAAGRVGNLMEDERILGAFNIAGGNNTLGWPGTNHSTRHFDGMMLQASYWVDDVPVCERGQFVHPALTAER